MAYAETHTASRNTTTLALVAGLHAALFYGIVVGLSGHGFGPKDEPKIEASQIKNVNEPVEQIKPVENDSLPIDQKVTYTEAVPPVGGEPLTPFGLGNETASLGDGGGLGEVEFPVAKVPDPLPSFAAKGPRPRGDASKWVTQESYPTREINLGHEGLTRVRLSISPNGKVSGCEVTASSGWPALDAAACRGLSAKGKFDPATDTSGEPASGTWNTSVKWQLPE